MFITKASRHDKADIQEFLSTAGPWDAEDALRGTAFVAREGAIVGHVRLVEVAPQTSIVERALVREDKRRGGIGTQLMQAAMNNKGGKLFVCCDREQRPFFELFGFSEVAFDALPPEVQDHHREDGDYPTEEGDERVFMTAR